MESVTIARFTSESSAREDTFDAAASRASRKGGSAALVVGSSVAPTRYGRTSDWNWILQGQDQTRNDHHCGSGS
jgi:hypothetical protein